MYLLFFVGFAIGAGCGAWLFWQGLIEYDQLHAEYIKLLEEMQRNELFDRLEER